MHSLRISWIKEFRSKNRGELARLKGGNDLAEIKIEVKRINMVAEIDFGSKTSRVPSVYMLSIIPTSLGPGASVPAGRT